MQKGVYESYKKDFQNGIISVGNVCSADCFFCSQKWNPPGVIKNLKRFLTMEEIKHFTSLYLDNVRIVASALHNNSGEFFLHPNAAEILNFLAARGKLLKHTVIFTNGMDLTAEHVKVVKKLNLYISLSLNSSNIYTRKSIMGNSEN